MTRKSCIYRGTVRHTRTGPKANAFRYALYMLYLDLDELPTLFQGRWLWSFERRNVFSYRRQDYLGDPQRGLDECVRDLVAERLEFRPEGPIRMLTQLRSFGFVFNPVTFYYCFDRDERLAAVVAEINNTPWNERHRYVFPASRERHSFAKEFHISPFASMDIECDWSFPEPGAELSVRMANIEVGERNFEAVLELERRPWTARALAAAVARHPVMSAKIVAGIYWQAARLWWKRAPVFAHPDTPKRALES